MNCSFCQKPFKKNAKIVTIVSGTVLNGEYPSYRDSLNNSIHICENDFNLSIQLILRIFKK